MRPISSDSICSMDWRTDSRGEYSSRSDKLLPHRIRVAGRRSQGGLRMSLCQLACAVTTLLIAAPMSAQRQDVNADSLEASARRIKSIRPDTALAQFRKLLAIRTASLDRRGEATALSEIGEVHVGAGRLDSARVAYDAALAIRRSLGDIAGQGEALSNIGDLHSKLGQLDSAFATLRQALALVRQARDAKLEGTVLMNIGHAFWQTGSQDSA